MREHHRKPLDREIETHLIMPLVPEAGRATRDVRELGRSSGGGREHDPGSIREIPAVVRAGHSSLSRSWPAPRRAHRSRRPNPPAKPLGPPDRCQRPGPRPTRTATGPRRPRVARSGTRSTMVLSRTSTIPTSVPRACVICSSSSATARRSPSGNPTLRPTRSNWSMRRPWFTGRSTPTYPASIGSPRPTSRTLPAPACSWT